MRSIHRSDLDRYIKMHHSSCDTRIKSSNSAVSIRPFEKERRYIYIHFLLRENVRLRSSANLI